MYQVLRVWMLFSALNSINWIYTEWHDLTGKLLESPVIGRGTSAGPCYAVATRVEIERPAGHLLEISGAYGN